MNFWNMPYTTETMTSSSQRRMKTREIPPNYLSKFDLPERQNEMHNDNNLHINTHTDYRHILLLLLL